MTPMNGTHTKPRIEGKALTKRIVEIAHGKSTQRQLAEDMGTDPGTLSTQMPGLYKATIQDQTSEIEDWAMKFNALSTKFKTLQSDANELQRLANASQEETNAAQIEVEKFQRVATEAQREAMSFQLERDAVKGELEKLQLRVNVLQSKYDVWNGQIKPVKALKGKWAKFTWCVLLILLDWWAIGQLLSLAVPALLSFLIATGLAFMLLTFTMDGNRAGRWFSIALSFLAAGLFFDVLPALVAIANAWELGALPEKKDMAAVVFTVIPPAINVILSKMLK